MTDDTQRIIDIIHKTAAYRANMVKCQVKHGFVRIYSINNNQSFTHLEIAETLRLEGHLCLCAYDAQVDDVYMMVT